MITYKWIDSDSDYSDALYVRRRVFIEEQGYSEAMEIVPDEESAALHLAVYDDGKPIGSGRLIPDREPNCLHAGRIAVLKSHRGKGLGKYIVDLLTEKAREKGAEKVYIGAQKYAVPFYEKCGYLKCSVVYPDGHIPHIMMCRSFAFENIKWQSFNDESDSVIFRNDFNIPCEIKEAKADIITLGFFEAYINGKRISDEFYMPAWTDYIERNTEIYNYPIKDEMIHRAYYKSFDITEFVKKGGNALALHIGNGWYGQGESKNEGVLRYGELKACYKITVKGADGKNYVCSSDELGKYKKSFVDKTNIYFGEYHDYRHFNKDIFNSEFGGWKDAVFTEAPKTIICRQTCPSDRVLRNIFNPKIIYSFGDTKIYDIGENLAGFAVLKFPEDCAENHIITVRYAEKLNSDGSLNFNSVGGSNRIGKDDFRCGGSDSANEYLYPRFTWHAGRYIEVRGEHRFVCFCLTASDIKVSSSFESSDENLNWLYNAYIRTQQSNIHCCVPSDCPHRERLGYTGDGQLAARACMSVFDAKELYKKWIRDVADCQDIENGHIQHTAPFYGGGGGPGGWGCAITAVPWYFYEFYGDKGILEEYYIHMKKYLDYMQSRCDDNIVMCEEPGGWCLGDWCPPYGKPKIPEPFVNTYFYIRSIRQTVKAAEIIGNNADIEAMKLQDKLCCDALTVKFFDSETGSFCEGVEGADSFAVDLGLGDERTLANLVSKYEKLGMYDTGIFGTDIVTKVLFEKGFASLAFKLLAGDNKVSFAHMRNSGATTLWENWFNGHSLSHPMFGAVTEYLFKYILGIGQKKNSAGFKEIEIAPVFLPELEWARGSIQTESGTVFVQVKNGRLDKYEIKKI